MANVNRINGFRPVKHLTGAPYNGQANIYEVPAGEAVPVFVGDPVVLSNSAATAGVGETHLSAFCDTVTDRIIISKQNSAGSPVALTDADFTNSTVIQISFNYRF